MKIVPGFLPTQINLPVTGMPGFTKRLTTLVKTGHSISRPIKTPLIKAMLLLLLMALGMINAAAQKKPASSAPGLSRAEIEKLKKMLPAGTKLPAGKNQPATAGATDFVKPLITVPAMPQPVYTAPEQKSASTATYSIFGSGRNEAQRQAAIDAINLALDKLPMLLPSPASTPTKSFMLQLAEAQSKQAHKKFTPQDLTNYSTAVNWVPQFNDKDRDPQKAKKYSLAVSLATNSGNASNFLIAFAAAVFSLDPESSSNANNLAAAILAGAQALYNSPLNKATLALCRRDAESAYLFAIYISMKDGKWSEASLTPVINMGNLCIDLGKLEQARSLFLVARKIQPASWDAALGLAAYFHAIKQPAKAVAVLEDDNLDKPQQYMIAIRQTKAAEKNQQYANLPMDSPDEVYEAGIKAVAAEPILTAADFISQIDQSERNKMRYFIEHLPPEGSYAAPSISKLSQYASLKAISSAQGVSALKDFNEMYSMFFISSGAATLPSQVKVAERMGLKVDMGMDVNDFAKHPEKYMNNKFNPKVKISGMNEFKANLQKMVNNIPAMQRDMAKGNFSSMLEMGATADPFWKIVLINPGDYADPMNILMQKLNFWVYQRKKRLYEDFLFSVNRRVSRHVLEDVNKAREKIAEIGKRKLEEEEEFERKAAEAKKQGIDVNTAEWKLQFHNIHQKYFKEFNNAAETGFGSAANIASVAYVQKVKPTVENYYYDIIRHIALICDPEVRDEKEAELRKTIGHSLTLALQSVLIAHGSFSYSDDWDCNCDMEELLQQREEEKAKLDEEEEARRERNKQAKAQFDSKEIPDASPLFKRLDAYADEYNFILIKVRVSCARTTIEANSDFLPNDLPASFYFRSTESENSGVVQRTAGIKAGISKDVGAASVSANLNLELSVTSDGQGVVRDYSVTPAAEVSVEVGNFNATVSGNVVVGPNGVRDYSAGASAGTSVTYGNTTVTGGASVTVNTNGVETEFSGGISHDLSNEVGGDANISMEASTKTGCAMSAKVEQTLTAANDMIKNSGAEDIGQGSGIANPIDADKMTSKELWSGMFEIKEKK